MTGFQIFRNTLIVLVAVGLVVVLYLTRDVWVLLIIAILIASALRPVIVFLKRLHMPQGVAILLAYGLLTFSMVGLLVAVLPPAVNQFVSYIQNDNRLAERIISAQAWTENFLQRNTGSDVQLGIQPDDIRKSVHDAIENVRVTAPTLVADIGNFLGNFILTIVMGIYWTFSRERAENFIIELLPIGRQAVVKTIVDEVESGLGAYVRGVVIVAVTIGTLCYIPLTLLGVPGAATIAFLYALTTSVPIIGSTIGVILATALALLNSPSSAAIVLVVTFVLQQFEAYILSPRLISQRVDFDAILVLVFLAAGFSLDGVMGALLAIPVAAAVIIILKHLVITPRKASVVPDRVEGGLLLKTPEVQE
jgi:predicted PurR-regulated permease PerM